MKLSRRIETILVVVSGLVLACTLAIWLAPHVGRSRVESPTLPTEGPELAVLRTETDSLERRVEAKSAEYAEKYEGLRQKFDRVKRLIDRHAHELPHHESGPSVQLIPTSWTAGPMLIPTHWDAKLVLVASDLARTGTPPSDIERILTNRSQALLNQHVPVPAGGPFQLDEP